MSTQSLSIQFVCLGNICRSPAAQGVMESLLRKLALDESIQADSSGTAGYHIGRPPDSRMLAAASRRGYHLTSLAKQFTPAFASSRTLIVAMDQDNYDGILATLKSPTDNVRRFSDYLDDSWPRNVPDPYYGGEAGFEYVLDMLEAGCPNILAELQKKLP